jgi:hypothetical protein
MFNFITQAKGQHIWRTQFLFIVISCIISEHFVENPAIN